MAKAGPILIDAGPLVAVLNRRDRWHEWAVEVLSGLTEPLVTCDAVLSEAVFLLRHQGHGGVEKLCAMIERGLVRSENAFSEYSDAVVAMLRKYDDLPISFADACLVAMAEANPDAVVFTVDSDFKIYRKRDRRVVPLIFPES